MLGIGLVFELLISAADTCAGLVPYACWMLTVGLHIIGRLLIGLGKKLKPVQLCCHTVADKRSKELVWCMVHNSSSKARWGPAVFRICC